MKSMVCTAMKSKFWLIVLVATVDGRSRFKPHSRSFPLPDGPSDTTHNETEWSETTEKIATHPEAIIMNNDEGKDSTDSPVATHPPPIIMNNGEGKDSKENLGFEMTNPNKVSAGELYQSDMLLSDDQWAALRSRKAIDNEDMRWTEGSDGNPLVPYVFQDSVDQDDVRAGLDHWMEHTCIKFEETTNTDQPHLQFHIGSGCWSNVGMLYWADGQQISIGNGCNSLGTVVHEVGHAMGFFHEQSRSDRDSYVTVLWENLADNSQSVTNFGTENDNNYSVPYDYTSIMHYGKSYFSINNQPTLVTNDILDIGLLGRRDGLSHRDKLLANRMYSCIGIWLYECGLSSDPCLNDGYTGKDCSCVCPPGTSGSNCAETVGDYYATPGCGGQFSSSTGTIQHPQDGDSYDNNERCIWTINAAVPIKITFTSFDTEDKYDYLYIRDGVNTELPLAGNFTGDDVPSIVQISTTKAYLIFSSDHSQTSDGFELQWEPSGIEPPTTQSPTGPPSTQSPSDPPTTQPPTTVVSDSPTTTPAGCGGEYTSSSGTIRHPLSGSSYENNENCVWTIRTGNFIKITVTSFDLENNYDYLYIRDGNSIDSTVLGNFTGTSVPSPVQANSGAAYLLFTSDYSATRAGFALQWETLDSSATQPPTDPPTTQPPTTIISESPITTPSGCGGDYISSSGIIRQPLSGSSYENNENCIWTIRTGGPIRITFTSFDLENSYDYLYIRDGNSIDSSVLGNFTGTSVPGPVQANSGEAYLLFTSDHSVTRAGFVLQWETLDGDYSTTEDYAYSTTTEDDFVSTTGEYPHSSTDDDFYSTSSDYTDSTSAPVCGGECSFSSGTIRHPSNGGNYQNNEHCVWIIRTANPINITFISFSTEANYDFLYVRNGATDESPLLGTFSGSTLPSPVQANSDVAYLLFTSDHSVTSTGFDLIWEPIL